MVRQYGQIRLHFFGLSIDRGRWGQTVKGLIYDEMLRVEQANHWLVASPCVDSTGQRRMTEVAPHGRQPYHHVQAMQ
jgi:hypothetical protein